MKLPRFKCLKCGHIWIPRREGTPRICPKCKSIRWDEPLNPEGVGAKLKTNPPSLVRSGGIK